jgi:hypothetical protein
MKNFPISVKNNKICAVSNCFSWSSVCFGSIETSKLSVSVQKRNNQNKLFRNKPKQTETFLHFLKKIPKYALYQAVCFGLIETPKLSVSV